MRRRPWCARGAGATPSSGVTGRSWDEWCDLIDGWPGHVDGHPAVAAWLHSETNLNGWWSQAVTVGWERITGRRVPNQRADGTFEAGKSKTVTVDVAALRAALFDDDDRADLFPGLATAMRSKTTTKSPRVAFPEGSVLFDFAPLDDGRVRITVAHGKLESPEAVETSIGTFHLDADQLAAVLDQEVDLGAPVSAPGPSVVQSPTREGLFDDEPFPACANLRVAQQFHPVGQPEQSVK